MSGLVCCIKLNKRPKNIVYSTLAYFFLVIVIMTACTGIEEEPPLDRISMTFMAGYKPQANLPFVGVYVAQEKGFFDQENLDVIIKHSPGKGEHLQLLAVGEIQVTTQDAAVLLKRRVDPGLPLVSFALIGQKGQQAFAALKDSGLKTPKDWERKQVGFKGTPPPDLYALLRKAGADETRVDLINVGFDPRVLTEGQVDVYPVYKSNEPFLIESWGYELILWDPSDYGINMLGLTYVTSDEILKENPDMLVRFLRAALKGIEYAQEHREEAVGIVMQYTGPETDPDHMRFMLEAELLDMHSEITDKYGLGWQTEAQWQALAQLLIEYEIITSADVGLAFTNEILDMVKAAK
jgi:ABC-type nitrate/sulfonate/bicarbonate transport system substrate-binding protein